MQFYEAPTPPLQSNFFLSVTPPVFHDRGESTAGTALSVSIPTQGGQSRVEAHTPVAMDGETMQKSFDDILKDGGTTRDFEITPEVRVWPRTIERDGLGGAGRGDAGYIIFTQQRVVSDVGRYVSCCAQTDC